MEKMTGESLDLTQENINRLKELFPEVLTEKKIDFDKLRLILGDEVETSPERYEFRWNGKNEAIKLSQTPSMGTLRPDKESSKNWDTTENLYIEGDNLEVLKLLQKSYFGKIKMIYIDPPYNTGKDFVYKDNFHDNIANYKEITNQSTKANPETNGRFHTDWLNMMYPRLRLARNLLKEDGIIVINIDENEFPNLHKICDELYGESNSLGTIVWDKRNPKGDAKGIAYQHEYILIYAKNKNRFLEICDVKRMKKNAKSMIEKAQNIFNKVGEGYSLELANKEYTAWINKQQDLSGGEKAYNKIDENGDVYRLVSMAWPNKSQAPKDYFIPLIHPQTGRECPVPERGWRNPSNTMKELQNRGLIVFGKDESVQPQRKYFLKENMYENIPSLLYYGGSDTELLSNLKIPFDTPKVVNICKEHIQSFCQQDDIILDFFSGSSTIAHATMLSNLEDNKKRKFIMVQLPEQVDEKHEAFKVGYKNICDIGKDRIRRAGDMISADSKNTGIDTGFKVFKLDDSNIKRWDPNTKDLENTIFNSTQNMKENRTQEDLLYELMLKMGIELTTKIEEISVAGKVIYSIQFGGLVICLENEITKEMIDYIPTLKSPFMEMKVVFKEYGFKSDADKMNAIQNLKQHGIKDVRSV